MPPPILNEILTLRRDIDKVTDGGGKRVMIQLFFTYYLFCKAMARDWVLASAIPFYGFILGADDSTTNNMYTASRSPFGIKTLWGSLSDAQPCLGYHKRFYILWAVCVSMSCLLGLVALGNYAIAYPSTDPAGFSMGMVQITTLLIFGFEYGGATTDSLTQARYTELMKKMGSPTIVSFVWFLMNSCTLISAWGNLLLREGNWMVLLYFAIPAGLPMLIPASLNWLQELPAKEFCKPDTKKVTQHFGIFAMSMVLAFGALGGTGIMIFSPDAIYFRVGYFAVLSTVFVIMSFNILPYNIAAPAFYMFLCSTLRLYFSGTLQYWYTLPNRHYGQLDCIGASVPGEDCSDVNFIDYKYACIPNGPMFSTSYYQFVGNFIGAIAATAAVVIFEKVIVHWNVRAAFWVTTMFQMGSTMLEVSALMRWNHGWFGTDPYLVSSSWVDQMTFLIGTQAIDKIVEMLDFMPCNVLIGNLCPPNIEATIFAVLAGSQNFGTNLAFVFGSIVVGQVFNVSLTAKDYTACVNPDTTVGPITLNGIAWARICGGVLLPAITIPLTFVLLPDRKLTERFLDEEETAAQLGLSNPDEAPPPSLADLPRGMSGITATSFVSLASVSKGVPGGRGGDFLM